MKKTIFIIIAVAISSVFTYSFAQIQDAYDKKKASNNYRDFNNQNYNSYQSQTQTSGDRPESSSKSHSDRGGADYSTKGMSDNQARQNAQQMSKESGGYTQYEKVDRANNTQTDYQYQNGNYLGEKQKKPSETGATGNHIHSQNPQGRDMDNYMQVDNQKRQSMTMEKYQEQKAKDQQKN